MRKIFTFCLISFHLCFISCDNKAQSNEKEDNGDLTIKAVIIVKDLESPVGFESAGDGTGRMFVVEQPGAIKIFKGGKVEDKLFLDIRSKIVKQFNAYSERGLLGLAFHPSFKTNGRFFVYYSAPSQNKESDHKSVVSEFKVTEDGSSADPSSERIILEIEQPESNHNGGQLAFGPDGFLYIGVGDGGGAGDKHGKFGNAQDLTNLLGKILRIDIDKAKPYAIPQDNPFAEKEQRKEIFAYGLRNPWRFSFDNGKLYCADVGQNKYEEISLIEKGKNYGWRYKEGFHEFDPELKDIVQNPVEPIFEYGRDFGISITGGYVYRGKNLNKLNGAYLFADWTGNISSISMDNGKWIEQKIKLTEVPEVRINSFGKDDDGEIYVVAQEKVGAKSPTGLLIKLSAIK